jgi:hypothetical protein
MTHDMTQRRLAAREVERGRPPRCRARLVTLASLAGLSALLPARTARAACDAARAVALEIDDQRDASLRKSVERHVAAELRASDIGVCDSSASAVFATVHIRTPGPELPRAAIRVSRAEAGPLERELDVTSLPLEARALAIAITTDELVRAALAAPARAKSEAPPTDALPSEPARPAEVDTLDSRDAPDNGLNAAGRAPQARFELGLAGAAQSLFGQREALGADLTARYWLTSRVGLDIAAGVARRLSRPIERGSVQPAHDVHAALGAGYELWRIQSSASLVARAGLELARVGFDERTGGSSTPITADDYFTLIASSPTSVDPLDSAWWLLAHAGIEGRYRAGSVGFGLVVNGLVPCVPAESDWGDTTSLDQLGVEARAGVWMALGKSE